jgi:hypothetical protein
MQGDEFFFPHFKMQKRIGNGWKKESPLGFSFELNWGNDGWKKENSLEFSFELNRGK